MEGVVEICDSEGTKVINNLEICHICKKTLVLVAWITGCLRAVKVCKGCAVKAEKMPKSEMMKVVYE